MNWIIFFVYLVLFTWLVTAVPFFRRAGLSKKMLCLLFLVKIIAGIAYFGFYSLPANKPNSDTWKFYNRSIPETDLLLTDPITFGKNLFVSGYGSTGGLFSDRQSYWNDVKDEVMVKLMAVANVCTGKNYYANIILFNFLFFFGLVAFFRLVNEIYPARKSLLVIAVFLMPSFLFWCSGIHKDGLIFSALGLSLYSFHHLLRGKKIALNTILVFFTLLLIFLLRNALAIALVPALLTGYLVHLSPRRKVWTITAVLVLGITLVFTARYLYPSLDIPRYIAEKQAQFKKLQGGSAVATPDLQPTFAGFVTALPSALDIAFLRPHPGEKGISSIIAFAEIILTWIIFIFCLFASAKNISHPPVVWTGWLFALITLLIIGYTVHFSGAVVRYRAPLIPLILAPALGSLGSKYIKKKYI